MLFKEKMNNLQKAIEIISNSKRTSVITGAGISVDSGIAPFRGKGSPWNDTIPDFLRLSHFTKYPENSWISLRKFFYSSIGNAMPNAGHISLAELENNGFIKRIITQNIDSLHTAAGSKNVIEFHGSLKKLKCLSCSHILTINTAIISEKLPLCSICKSTLKPDIVFYEESLIPSVIDKSLALAEISDCMLIIGTSAQVMPASNIPYLAKRAGARIIEINIEETNYTREITDVFLKGSSSQILTSLKDALATK